MTKRCPTCKKPASIAPENDHRPFCSNRCQLIDLGAWLSEDYVIDGKPSTDDESPTYEPIPRQPYEQ